MKEKLINRISELEILCLKLEEMSKPSVYRIKNNLKRNLNKFKDYKIRDLKIVIEKLKENIIWLTDSQFHFFN